MIHLTHTINSDLDVNFNLTLLTTYNPGTPNQRAVEGLLNDTPHAQTVKVNNLTKILESDFLKAKAQQCISYGIRHNGEYGNLDYTTKLESMSCHYGNRLRDFFEVDRLRWPFLSSERRYELFISKLNTDRELAVEYLRKQGFVDPTKQEKSLLIKHCYFKHTITVCNEVGKVISIPTSGNFSMLDSYTVITLGRELYDGVESLLGSSSTLTKLMTVDKLAKELKERYRPLEDVTSHTTVLTRSTYGQTIRIHYTVEPPTDAEYNYAMLCKHFDIPFEAPDEAYEWRDCYDLVTLLCEGIKTEAEAMCWMLSAGINIPEEEQVKF